MYPRRCLDPDVYWPLSRRASLDISQVMRLFFQGLAAMRHIQQQCTSSSSPFCAFAKKSLQSRPSVIHFGMQIDVITFSKCRRCAGMGGPVYLWITHFILTVYRIAKLEASRDSLCLLGTMLLITTVSLLCPRIVNVEPTWLERRCDVFRVRRYQRDRGSSESDPHP
jgi:hypothetical protein